MYTFTTRTAIGGSQWTFEAEFGSQTEAIEWAKRNAVDLMGWKSFMGIDVWNGAGSSIRAADHIAYVTVGEPSVKVSGLKARVA